MTSTPNNKKKIYKQIDMIMSNEMGKQVKKIHKSTIVHSILCPSEQKIIISIEELCWFCFYY